jgi:hypothetical protein
MKQVSENCTDHDMFYLIIKVKQITTTLRTEEIQDDRIFSLWEQFTVRLCENKGRSQPSSNMQHIYHCLIILPLREMLPNG